MGWNSLTTDWVDMPCQASSQFTYNDNSQHTGYSAAKCKFYPGGTTGNSYIKAYGFDSPQTANDFELRFPRIGWADQTNLAYTTKMYVQIVEETLGERSEKVVLYNKEIENIGLSAQGHTSYSHDYGVNGVLTNTKPDTTSVCTFTFTAPVASPFTLILDFSANDHYKFTVRSSKACTNCYIYEEPYSWIVVDKPAGTASGASFTVAVTNFVALYYEADI